MKTWQTVTGIAMGPCLVDGNALGPMLAAMTFTSSEQDRAVLPTPGWGTVAHIVIYTIFTGRTMETGLRRTIINIDRTQYTCRERVCVSARRHGTPEKAPRKCLSQF